jgi:curved DNA-binding protein CbpA
MTAFDVLGLPASRELTDDDVRVAWRRVAAATHPDRTDGGDPAAFAAAAAAYTLLRTSSGRGEALADLREAPTHPRPSSRPPTGARTRWPGHRAALKLGVRLLAAAAAVALSAAAVGWQPASFAILAGALTWLLVASRTVGR